MLELLSAGSGFPWVLAALSAVVAGGIAWRRRWQRRVRELEASLELKDTDLRECRQETERLELELLTTTQRLKRLRRLVAADPLTGIANRRHFDRTLEREVRRACRERTPLSLIFCDIDGFKAFNDTQGHTRGDEVLVQVARVLNETFRRGSDLAARYGGEEFVVILPGVDSQRASLYAERLRRRIWRLAIPYVQAPVADRVTISAGVATLTAEELSTNPSLLARAPQVLLNSADAALYRAKCLGRNRVAVRGSAGAAVATVELAAS